MKTEPEVRAELAALEKLADQQLADRSYACSKIDRIYQTFDAAYLRTRLTINAIRWVLDMPAVNRY